MITPTTARRAWRFTDRSPNEFQIDFALTTGNSQVTVEILRAPPGFEPRRRFCRFSGVVNPVVSCCSLVCPAAPFCLVFWPNWTTFGLRPRRVPCLGSSPRRVPIRGSHSARARSLVSPSSPQGGQCKVAAASRRSQQWRCLPAFGSDRTRSSPRSARAVWVKCIGRAMRGSGATSRSRSCRRTSRAIRIEARASSRRRVQRRR